MDGWMDGWEGLTVSSSNDATSVDLILPLLTPKCILCTLSPKA